MPPHPIKKLYVCCMRSFKFFLTGIRAQTIKDKNY